MVGALAEVYGGRLLEYGAFDLVRTALTLGDTEDFVMILFCCCEVYPVVDQSYGWFDYVCSIEVVGRA